LNGLSDTRHVDLLIAGAAIVISLIVAYSVVDYLLRTGAMMALFALARALLVEPLDAAQNASKPQPERERAEEVVRRVLAVQAPTAPDEPERPVKTPPQPPQGNGVKVSMGPTSGEDDRQNAGLQPIDFPKILSVAGSSVFV
jgi:hypothetical protein